MARNRAAWRPDGPPLPSAFQGWFEERRQLETSLDQTPEDQDPRRRERLFRRAGELERLIFDTEAGDLSAIRVKAAMLTWLMEMQGSEDVTPMRQILNFLNEVG